MPENADNLQNDLQGNLDSEEVLKKNSEINALDNEISSENENEDAEPGEEAEKNEDELPLPEPDLTQEDEKKKKDQPEWLKRKLERERRKESERLATENAEKERLREENERLKAQNPALNPQMSAPQGDVSLPQREHYADDASYFLAVADYREAKRATEFQHAQRVKQFEEHEKRFQTALKDTVEEGKTKYKDFEERTDFILYGDGFPSNRGMAEAIIDSPYRDDVLYFLGTNEKEALRIATLNPISAAKEIAKIEGRFEAKRKSNIPKAPNPLSPLSGGKGSAMHKDPVKMSGDEFKQWYADKFG